MSSSLAPHYIAKKRFAPGSVAFKRSSQDLEQKIKDYPFILVRGLPLTGKSTLLRQWMQGRSSCFEMVLEKKTSLQNLIFQMIEAFGLKKTIKEVDPNAQISLLFQWLNETKSTLVLHCFDRLDCGESFAEAALDQLREGRVVASCLRLPPIEASRIFDIGLVEHAGFDLRESKDFIEKSGVSLAGGDALIKEIHRVSGGHPYFIRLLLSRAIFENRAFSKKDLELGLVDAELSYLKAVTGAFDRKTLDVLKKLSLIEWDSSLFNEMLCGEFPDQETRSDLVGLGILRLIQSGRYLFHDQIRKSLRSQITNLEEKNGRRKIIKTIDQSSGCLSSQKEKIHQLIECGDLEAAATLFNQVHGDLKKESDGVAIKELSEKIKKLINFEALKTRLSTFQQCGAYSKALEEIKERLGAERCGFELLRLEAEFLGYLAPREAIPKFEDLLEKYPAASEERAYLLFELAYLTYTTNSARAKTFLSEARDLCNKFCVEDVRLRSNLELLLGNILVIEHDVKSASEAFLRACECVESLDGPRSFLLNSKIHYAQQLYRLGRYSDAISMIAEIKKEAGRLGLKIIQGYCDLDLAQYAFDNGDFQEAESLMKPVLSAVLAENWGRGLLPAVHFSIKLFIAQSKFREAKELVKIVVERDERVNFSDRVYLIQAYERLLDSLGTQESFFLQLKKELTEFKIHQSHRADLLQTALLMGLPSGYIPCANLLAQFRDRSDFGAINEALDGLIMFVFAVQSVSFSGVVLGPLPKLQLWKFFYELGELMSEKSLFKRRRKLQELKLEIGAYSNPEDCLVRFLSTAIEILTGERCSSSNFYGAVLLQQPGLQSRELATSSACTIYTRDFIEKISRSEAATLIEQMNIVLDVENKRAEIFGSSFKVSSWPITYRFLFCLLKNQGRPISKERICTEVWGEVYNPLVQDARIYTTVRRLRADLRNYSTQGEEVIREEEGCYSISREINFALLEQ